MTLVLANSFPPLELLPLSHFSDTRPVGQHYIDEAETIDGVRVIRMDHMLEWKQAANRPKDQDDIIILSMALAK